MLAEQIIDRCLELGSVEQAVDEALGQRMKRGLTALAITGAAMGGHYHGEKAGYERAKEAYKAELVEPRAPSAIHGSRGPSQALPVGTTRPSGSKVKPRSTQSSQPRRDVTLRPR